MMTLAAGMLAAGCGQRGFNPNAEIGTVSREDGSGTRTAFTEMFGILRKENGKKVDHTTVNTIVAGSTAVMLTTVSGDINTIGYLSLGSMNDTVRALAVDSAEPTAANIRSGAYKVTHPFNLLTKADLSPAALDFLSFIKSAEGQKIVEANGYVSVDQSAKKYVRKSVSGKVTVSGSSSVTPLMEKFKEAYVRVNPDMKIEVQQSDSSTGVADARDGVSDIGMASRGLKDAEKGAGLVVTACAIDGIAMIVHPDNPLRNIKSSTVRDVYEGRVTTWAQAGK